MVVELAYRLAILVAIRRFHGMGVVDSHSLRSDSYVCMHHFVRRYFCPYTYAIFRRFWGDVWREFMQLLSVARHSTLGSYLHDALQEGNADAVACLHAPRA
jgi:hypothetical protein